jgi:hypothetical protein
MPLKGEKAMTTQRTKHALQISFGFSTPPQLFDVFLLLVTVTLLLSFCIDHHSGHRRPVADLLAQCESVG